MKRDTQEDKPRFDLCFPEGVPYSEQMFTRFAQLMTRGQEKYGPRNWELSNSEEELNRFKGSALRHCLQWFLEEVDEDHASAVLFNITAAETLKYKRKGINGDTNASKESDASSKESDASRKNYLENCYEEYYEEYDFSDYRGKRA